MLGKTAEEDYYDDDFEEYSDGLSPAKAQPVAAAAAAEPAPAAAAAASSAPPAARAPSHTTQLFAGHSNAQQWEDVDFADVTLGKKLGGGGFAIVYTGTWKGQNVALKTLFDPTVDDALKTEFMDELHVMRALSHPNIVTFMGACTTAPKMFIIMELCPKGSLFNLLHNSGVKLSYSQRVPLLSHNLLIDAKWRVKLCDFGLVTTKYVTAGTPQYLAPELIEARPYSRKVDVYAFGILMWEVLARRVPFNGWKPADIVAHVTAGNRPDISASTFGLEADAVADLLQLMQRCWAQDPTERPEFAELVATLDAWKPRQSAMAKATHKLGGGDALDSMLGGGGGSRSRRK